MAADHSSYRRVYRISEVSRMTGVAPHTLRAWERRYETVKPDRSSGGERLYTDEDVERLLLMHRLQDHGHAIGRIAHLTADELRDALARYGDNQMLHAVDVRRTMVEQPGSVRLGVLDPRLAARGHALAHDAPALDLVHRFDSVEGALRKLREAPIDVLVVHLSSLGALPWKPLEKMLDASPDVRFAVVTYDFAPRELVRRVTSERSLTLKEPYDLRELERTVLDGMFRRLVDERVSDDGGFIEPATRNAPPRFTTDQLGRLQQLDSAIKCECPNHLATLISSLADFERYCRECESRNEQDARVHRMLYVETGKARTIVEEALQTLVAIENIQF
jgi:DNA-binding transcriptional MerR regulator